jgi:hypothetical protein
MEKLKNGKVLVIDEENSTNVMNPGAKLNTLSEGSPVYVFKAKLNCKRDEVLSYGVEQREKEVLRIGLGSIKTGDAKEVFYEVCVQIDDLPKWCTSKLSQDTGIYFSDIKKAIEHVYSLLQEADSIIEEHNKLEVRMEDDSFTKYKEIGIN